MLTPGTLVATLSELLDWPAETITFQARLLRQAGLISQHGRGKWAAKMTPLDAARLMIAVPCALTIADTVEVVAEFSALLWTNGATEQDRLQTLEQRLTALIEDYRNRALTHEDSDAFEYDHESDQFRGEIEFHFVGPSRALGGKKMVLLRKGPLGSVKQQGLRALKDGVEVFSNDPSVRPSNDDAAMFRQLFDQHGMITIRTIAPTVLQEVGKRLA